MPETGLQLLSSALGYDLAGYDINGPLPEIALNDAGGSRAQIMVDVARRNNFTIRDLYRHIAGARGHYQVNGTPNEIADMMEQWVTERACDGFNVMPPLFPGSLRSSSTGDPRAAAPRRLPHALRGDHAARQSRPHAAALVG